MLNTEQLRQWANAEYENNKSLSIAIQLVAAELGSLPNSFVKELLVDYIEARKTHSS